MAAKSVFAYDYVAHIVKQDLSTVEIAGRRKEPTARDVYDFLVDRAKALNGIMRAQSITLAEAGMPVPTVGTRTIREAPSEDDVTFGVPLRFGLYMNKYDGASLCTYKITSED